ncbi:MAG: tetratricopeptide repeat protein [bacterium]|nr:tetratricopeptide repeat protein [bacterium]
MKILFLLWLSVNSNTGVLTEANNFYNAGQYEASIEKYETLINKGIINHTIYYNLGNCYFKLGKYGNAIYFYKKAKRLAPDDRDINFNLDFARSRRADNIKTSQYPKFITSFVDFFTSLNVNFLVLLTSILYFLLAIMIIMSLFKTRFPVKNYILGLFAALFVVLVVFIINFKMVNLREGVLIDSVAEVRSGPSEDYTLIFTIHEGMEMKILDEQIRPTTGGQESWLKITLPGGLEGWLLADKVKKL